MSLAAAGFVLSHALLFAASYKDVLRPCTEPALEGAYCGQFEVFENRGSKQGRKLALRTVVLPATGPVDLVQPDPLVSLAGGPGQGAAEGASGERRRFAEVLKLRDIVLVDQRGTGNSNPLQCRFDSAAVLAETLLGGRDPGPAIEECRQQLEGRADLRHYGTITAMEDLHDVLNWLGYKEVNLYGGSYGTRAALVFLRLHGDRVRTATLRAVMPPNVRMVAETPAAVERALRLLFENCAAQAACAAAYPDLKGRHERILATLAREPAKIEIRNPQGGAERLMLTRAMYLAVLRQGLGDSSMVAGLPGVIVAAATRQDYSGIARGISATVNSLGSAIALGLNLSINCAEEVRNTPAGGGGAAAKDIGDESVTLAKACAVWPSGEAPASYREPVRSQKPVLMLSGEIDSKTPPEWAERAAATLPNSRQVVFEGISHGPFPACGLRILSEFVAKGELKTLDTSCLAGVKRIPFRTPAATSGGNNQE